MSMPKGYKVTNKPKTTVASTRLNDGEASMLQEVADAKGVSKSDVLSMGIELQYYTLLKKRRKAEKCNV